MPGLFALDLNPLHLLIIAALFLLFFGNRLPGTMRSLGRGVVEFKKGLQGIEDDQEPAPNSTTEKIEKKSNTPQQNTPQQ